MFIQKCLLYTLEGGSMARLQTLGNEKSVCKTLVQKYNLKKVPLIIKIVIKSELQQQQQQQQQQQDKFWKESYDWRKWRLRLGFFYQ